MKKIYNYLIGALVATGMLCSCNNFDELNTNPDSPTTVTPEMLATKLILGTTSPSTSKAFFNSNFLMKHWHGEKELSITNIIKWGAPVLEGIQVWLME